MKTRLEADEVAAQLERCDKENKILKDEMNKEIEAVLRRPASPRPVFLCPWPSLVCSKGGQVFSVLGWSSAAHLLPPFSRLLSLVPLYLLPPGFFFLPFP